MSFASQLRREGRIEGRQEGRQEGLHEGQIIGRRQMLLRLVARRFGPPSPEQAARIEQAEDLDLERWTDRLLDADSIDNLID